MEWRAFHNYQKSGWSCLRKLGKEKKEKKEKKQVFPQGRIKAFLVRPYFFHTFLLSVVSQKFILFRLRSQNLWFMGNNFSSRRPLFNRNNTHITKLSTMVPWYHGTLHTKSQSTGGGILYFSLG